MRTICCLRKSLLLLAMSACFDQEHELFKTHEEILKQMESRREHLKSQTEKMLEESEAARQRNNALLQDMQQIEDRLRGRHLPRPDLLALETRYWTYVEESIPAWENFFLGKGPHPTDSPEEAATRTKQKPSTAKDRGLPPRPKPRTAR
ncbi:centrosomal protein 15 [Halichoeres trimaculatus]|uniref:centrosomal protein 15 n=1 Tax=Halichoeres trimaculatus TaxID=147232 RepID=UPI003D9EA0A7